MKLRKKPKEPDVLGFWREHEAIGELEARKLTSEEKDFMGFVGRHAINIDTNSGWDAENGTRGDYRVSRTFLGLQISRIAVESHDLLDTPDPYSATTIETASILEVYTGPDDQEQQIFRIGHYADGKTSTELLIYLGNDTAFPIRPDMSNEDQCESFRELVEGLLDLERTGSLIPIPPPAS